MAWFRVDDTLHSHPKARRAGLEAMGLWSLCGSWSMQYKTNGFVPEWYVSDFPRHRKLTTALVSAGLWRNEIRDGEAGFIFHDWLDIQPSAEEIERDRERNRERQRQWRKRLREGKKEEES